MLLCQDFHFYPSSFLSWLHYFLPRWRLLFVIMDCGVLPCALSLGFGFGSACHMSKILLLTRAVIVSECVSTECSSLFHADNGIPSVNGILVSLFCPKQFAQTVQRTSQVRMNQTRVRVQIVEKPTRLGAECAHPVNLWSMLCSFYFELCVLALCVWLHDTDESVGFELFPQVQYCAVGMACVWPVLSFGLWFDSMWALMPSDV